MTSISLLREKFTIREIGLDSTPVIALGNRLVINLPNHSIPLVIRAHSMHMTLRLGADIMRQLSFINHVENVENLFNWEEMWTKLITPYEQEATPETWIVIYYKGNPIYQDNFHHMFFDIIEQCEFKNNMADSRYEKSIIMAQKAFQQLGRNVLIEEESHVGFILDNASSEELRFAIILRMPGHKGTFITRLSQNDEQKIRPNDFTAMMIAASFIEALNMSVRAGFMEKNFPTNRKPSYEQTKAHANIIKRLKALSIAIDQAENKYSILYRPEKPDFNAIQTACKNS